MRTNEVKNFIFSIPDYVLIVLMMVLLLFTHSIIVPTYQVCQKKWRHQHIRLQNYS